MQTFHEMAILKNSCLYAGPIADTVFYSTVIADDETTYEIPDTKPTLVLDRSEKTDLINR